MIRIRHITQDDPLYNEQVLPLRIEILRKPIGLDNVTPDDLLADTDNIVLIAEKYDSSGTKPELVGCCMLRPDEPHTYKLRQMAVVEAERGQNIGKRLVEYSEQ